MSLFPSLRTRQDLYTRALTRNFQLTAYTWLRQFSREATGSRRYFDSDVKRLHLQYAKKVLSSTEKQAVGEQDDIPSGAEKYGYLFKEISTQLVDRLLDIKKKFPATLVLEPRTEHLKEDLLGQQSYIGLETLKETVTSTDNGQHEDGLILEKLESNAYDLVLSNLGLHWENELKGTFQEVNRVLEKDGVFLGALFCGDTLFELRTSLMISEQEREGGISPRISPMLEPSTLCSLLNATDFTLSTVDVQTIEIEYQDMFELMEHLGAMGESNANLSRRFGIRKDTLYAAASVYQELFPATTDPSSSSSSQILATFQIVFFIGWKKDASQPAPKDIGSGKVSLTSISTHKSS